MFNKLPIELQMYICEFLLHNCYLCEDKNCKYFDNEIYKCFDCKQSICIDHCIPKLNSSICYECFKKNKDNLYDELIEGISDIASICRTM